MSLPHHSLYICSGKSDLFWPCLDRAFSIERLSSKSQAHTGHFLGKNFSQEHSILNLQVTVTLPKEPGGLLFTLELTLPLCLSDGVSSPTSRKTGLPCSAQRGTVDVLCCHILILTLGKAAALPEPAQCHGHQAWPRSCLGANEPYLLRFSISPRARPQPTTVGQRDAGVAAHVHFGPLQASWWPPTTKPERAGNFLETSWNCSGQREKQPTLVGATMSEAGEARSH